MVFSNLIFLYLFLPVCLIAYFFCPGIRAKNAVLILFSLIFYAWGEPVYLLLMIASAAVNWYFGLPVGVAAVSSLFGVRALFSGILSASAQSGMTEMMIAAGAMILLLCVVEWIYMAAVKRSSSKYLLTLMAPEREE